MKRTLPLFLSLALCLLLFSSLSLASGITGKGVKIGLNIASLHGDDVEDLEEAIDESLKSKLGVCFGAFLTYSINEIFAVQPEVLFTQKGAKAHDEDWELGFNLSYFEIPVLAKIIIPTKGNIKPSLFAGPAIALKLSGNSRVKWDGEEDEENIEDGTDFGLIFGGGVDFGVGQGKLMIDIRYTLGLSQIGEIDGEDLEMKNGLFSIMLGFSF